MSIEDYNRQRDVKDIQSQGKLSPIRELLEQLFDMVVRLDHEGRFGASYAPRVGEVGGYRNGYVPDGVSSASGSLNSVVSKIPDTVDIPLYRNAVNRGQRSSEASPCFFWTCTTFSDTSHNILSNKEDLIGSV